MKKMILVVVMFLIIVAVGMFVFEKNKTKQPQQTAQDLRIQRDISEIRKFADSSDLAVQYDSDSKSSNGKTVPVSVYTAGADRYEVDASGKIIQLSYINFPVGSDSEKKYDNTSRYNSQELETMARQFIAKNASNVNLEKLTLTQGNKGMNYFFRWEDKSQKTLEEYPFIQVGFSQGGTFIGYINTL